VRLLAANNAMVARLGLGILPTDGKAAITAGACAILGVTVFVALLDGVVFRSHLDAGYVDFYTSPLASRTIPMCFKALSEEVAYRLVMMTAFVAIIKAVRGSVSPLAFVVMAVFAQFYGVWPYMLHDPLYASLRYLLVGTIWGLLYWKHGWITAASAHAFTHLILDPLLLLVLQPA